MSTKITMLFINLFYRCRFLNVHNSTSLKSINNKETNIPVTYSRVEGIREDS
jgi:hypothetical protein